MSTFDIFGEPNKEIVSTECDYDGVRQVNVYTLSGNASANPSIHVSTNLGCDKNNDEATHVIFTADKPSLNGDEVEVFWASFDTLKISFDANLRVFKEVNEITFKNSKLNFVVKYQKKEES